LGTKVERDPQPLDPPPWDGPGRAAIRTSTVVPIQDANVHCASCGLRRQCLAFGLDDASVCKLDALISARLPVKRKETLYRPGEPFSALYAIRLGTLKTLVPAGDGREQVTGYRLPGEIIGFDGIGDDRYALEATALEDSEVCVLSFNKLDALGVTLPALRRNLFRIASRDLGRQQTMKVLHGSRSGEERLAAFLLDVAERYRARGYSFSEFVLRMTRDEIASYLGLKLETVSRLFSGLQEAGLIQVQGRAVKLLDPANLRKLVARSPN
jgi:CRP/FNR family transcriptional regulator, anaerobic regulatory protein